MADITKPLTVYIPDTRGVVVSRYGKGNLKIGLGVYTYSRMPGLPDRRALGLVPRVRDLDHAAPAHERGSCPGSSDECRAICYAARPVAENGAVLRMWEANTGVDDVPPIPADAKLLRLHVSGDFDTVEYVHNWIARMKERPDVTMWVYTRSWRVPELLPHLETLRALPNVQMFASMDESIPEMPPTYPCQECDGRGEVLDAPLDVLDGSPFWTKCQTCNGSGTVIPPWRRAWIDGDVRGGTPQQVAAHAEDPVTHNLATVDGGRSYVCPEETKRTPNCEACKYCFAGTQNDVTFLRH
jgi:hypothetical protein